MAKATKEPLVQIQMNLPKIIPGFGRYQAYQDGRVENIATGREIANAATTSTGVNGFRLLNDKGQRAWVYPDAIAELFNEKKPEPIAEAKPGKRYVKRVPTRKEYKRLTDADKAEIQAACKANGGKLPRGEGKRLAIYYGVDEASISRVVNSHIVSHG
jgi:hypothetical protein